jgi:hypothetical protein
MIADVFDAVIALSTMYANANSKKKIKAPKPYPRPWVDDKTETRKIGKDAVTISDFESWWSGGRW